jgi:hypothetical protein
MAVKSVPPSVPSAVPSSANTVPVLQQPQRGPYQPMLGSPVIPEVPRTEVPGEEHIPGNPLLGHRGGTSSIPASGSAGSPSVPVDGFLFKKGPADPHYLSQYNPSLASAPRVKVNNPPTRGMLTWVKDYLNGIATTQDVDLAGWKERHPQQRTSWMRITPPPHGDGYSPETYDPRQMPQHPNTYKIIKATGTSPYGSGVLNSDTLGAGQVAGGIGGSNYTPAPGPPPTNSITGQPDMSGMPVWG